MSASTTATTNANINAVSANGYTALHLAAFEGEVKEVERLLASGADVDARTEHVLMTPLHIASERGHLEVVQTLLKYGANISACDDSGYAPHVFGFFARFLTRCCTQANAACDRGFAGTLSGGRRIPLVQRRQ